MWMQMRWSSVWINHRAVILNSLWAMLANFFFFDQCYVRWLFSISLASRTITCSAISEALVHLQVMRGHWEQNAAFWSLPIFAWSCQGSEFRLSWKTFFSMMSSFSHRSWNAIRKQICWDRLARRWLIIERICFSEIWLKLANLETLPSFVMRNAIKTAT